MVKSLPKLLSSWLSRNLTWLLAVLVALSAGWTYFSLHQQAAPIGMKPYQVWRLLTVNLILLLLLAGVVGWRIAALWRALRRQTAGSQLQKRMVTTFSLVTIIPTMVVTIFSVVFFNFGIQTWFNDRVNTAVEESLAVAEAYLSEHKENIRGDALAMAADLNPALNLSLSNPGEFNRIVETQAALRLLTEAVVFQHNRIIAQGRFSFALAFERIPQNILERAANGEVVITTTEDDKVRAITKLPGMDDTFLLVGRLIDSHVLDHMENTQGAVSEYHSLKEQLTRLQISFSGVFVSLTLVLLLGSVWYGLIFAARMAQPLSNLVTATERVRAGDFSAHVAASSGSDEISTLGRAFNRMTEQLEAQRHDLIDANRRLDERRRFSEAVLAGVSAGVIALDRTRHINLFNRSSQSLLAPGTEFTSGMPVGQLLPGILPLLDSAQSKPGEVIYGSLTVPRGDKQLNLHVRVVVERLREEIEGFIVTFDDITPLVTAQRSAAWADVARRVAHEIKNPLTPIQLAAERLKRKYAKLAEGEEAEMFIKYTDTITRHVADIGKMVEEFVSFARMPTPSFAALDLAALLRKTIFSEQVAHPGIDYAYIASHEPIMLSGDDRQLGQLLTNLLKNAAESIEATTPEGGHIALHLTPLAEGVRLTIRDNGPGFPADQMDKLFEPYVTNRSKGTGLGLAIAKKIMDDHKGLITLENNPDGGALVTLFFSNKSDIKATIDATG